jgi:hypothetical protein
VFTTCGIDACRQFSERHRGRLGSKISGRGQLAEAAASSPCQVWLRKQTPTGEVGMLLRRFSGAKQAPSIY